MLTQKYTCIHESFLHNIYLSSSTYISLFIIYDYSELIGVSLSEPLLVMSMAALPVCIRPSILVPRRPRATHKRNLVALNFEL